jgi:uncharacterized protein involved in exopolysaccharide biosynthesis
MTQETTSNAISTSSVASTEIEEEISLIDLAIALGEEKQFILKFTVGIASLAVVYSLLATPIYTAHTVIIPPQQQQSSAASALASLGALAGMAGAAAGIKSSDEMYIAFMQSDSMLDALIERFKLMDRYESKTHVAARETLKHAVKVTSDKKSGLITIEVEDKDSKFSAELANAYVDELRNLIGRLAVTDAQQRRVFYEQQIQRTQQSQAEAEVRLKQAKEKSGLQVSALVADSDVKASAEMRGQIAALEVQLEAMSRFATPQNPDFQKVSSRLSALRSQLAKIEQGSGVDAKFTPAEHEAVKAYRQIKAQEAMMSVLLAQYESARVDEAKEGPLVQQVDVALEPERRSKPKRAIIVVVSAFAGLFLSVLIAFVRRAWRKAQENDSSSQQLDDLRRAWAWGNVK